MSFSLNLHPSEFGAHHLSDSGVSVVDVFDGGGSKAAIFLKTPAQCDELIKAAVAAKGLLLGETSEPVEASLSRAVVADVDQAAPIWAVFEPTEGEVAGPFTHREASRWAEVNVLSFAGALTVGRARTDLPAAERPDNGPQRADAIGDHDCGAKGAEDYICTAAQGHTGPHMAYDGRVRDGAPPPSLCHSWPQVSAGDDAGRAIVADLDEQHAKTALTSPVPTRAEQVLPGGYSLPASEAGPGEQLAVVAPDDASMCETADGGLTCTRYRGHEGDHAAHGADDVKPVHTWPQHAGTDAQ